MLVLLLPILWIALAVLGVLFVVASWEWIPTAIVCTIVALAAIWILASVLSPAVPNRTCPKCHGEGLVKPRRGELGVRCEICGFADENMHVAYLDEW